MVSPQLYRRAIPSSGRIGRWQAPDGWSLRRFDWPATGTPKGRILFQGGRGDVFEKYLELFAYWHARGWSVTSLDWRGQGGSGRVSADPHVGDIDDFATYIADFAGFWGEWQPESAAPCVLMGHSMGGHLALRVMTEGVVRPDAAVLVAPMLGLHTPLGAKLGERLASLFAAVGNPARPAWKANERPATIASRQSLLTHDKDRYDDEIWWQGARPALRPGPPSWRWVARAFASTRAQRADPRLATMRVPVLMIVAEADKLVDPKAALQVAARLPDVQIVRFGKESAHEVLREADPVRGRAIAAIDAFLAAHVPAPSEVGSTAA